MPCGDSNSDSQSIYYLERRVNKLADMLCKQCEWSCLDISLNAPIHIDVVEWWEAHKIHDKNRLIRDKKANIEEIKLEIRQLEEKLK